MQTGAFVVSGAEERQMDNAYFTAAGWIGIAPPALDVQPTNSLADLLRAAGIALVDLSIPDAANGDDDD